MPLTVRRTTNNNRQQADRTDPLVEEEAAAPLRQRMPVRLGTHRLVELTLFVSAISLAILSLLKLEPTARTSVRDHRKKIINMPNEEDGRSKSTNTADPFTVDILSVSSIYHTDLLNAQRNAIGAHISVRNFFNVTENDDADRNCHKDLTWDHVSKVSNFCRRRLQESSPRYFSKEFQTFKASFARTQWLEKKASPAGWLCAQKRPVSGLLKITAVLTATTLPDYLIIMDDDTYWNIELFQEYFESRNSTEGHVVAGCMVRLPVHTINFTFPFGGFGTVLSRGALMNLFQPLNCGSLDNISNFQDVRCRQIAKNMVGELHLYREGMALVDLIYAYVNEEHYRDVDNWNQGFCMHSDWIYGYFFNWYQISVHVNDTFYADVPQARLEDYKGSNIYRKGTGFCQNDWDDKECKNGTEICHRAPIQWINQEIDTMRLKRPRKYKTYQQMYDMETNA